MLHKKELMDPWFPTGEKEVKCTELHKLIYGSGETQSQLCKSTGETQRKEHVVKIQHFYTFTGHFSQFYFGHDFKHRWKSKELAVLLIYLPQTLSWNFPSVWLCLLFPNAEVRSQSSQPGSENTI